MHAIVFGAAALLLLLFASSGAGAVPTLYATTGTDGGGGILRSCPPAPGEARTWTLWSTSTVSDVGAVGVYGGDAAAGPQLWRGKETSSEVLQLANMSMPVRTVSSGLPSDGKFIGIFLAVDGSQNASDPIFYQLYQSIRRVNGPGRLQRILYTRERVLVGDRSTQASGYESVFSHEIKGSGTSSEMINSIVYDSVTGNALMLGDSQLRYLPRVSSPLADSTNLNPNNTLGAWLSMPSQARGLVFDDANRLLFYLVGESIRSIPLAATNPFASTPVVATVATLEGEYLYAMAIDVTESTLYITTRNCTAFAVAYSTTGVGATPVLVSVSSINYAGIDTTNTPAALAVDPTGLCGNTTTTGNSSVIYSGRQCPTFDPPYQSGASAVAPALLSVALAAAAAAAAALAMIAW